MVNGKDICVWISFLFEKSRVFSTSLWTFQFSFVYFVRQQSLAWSRPELIPSRLPYSGFNCCVHTRKHTRKKKKKKHIRGRLTVDQDKTRARTRVSVTLVGYFGGKTSGNRGTTQWFCMFRIFCTNDDVARQKNILHEGKFLLNILTPLSYFFIQCRSFGFNNFFHRRPMVW